MLDASMLGKRTNCQTLVYLTLARDEVPIAAGLRLLLQESGTSDPLRMASAGVPEAFHRRRGPSRNSCLKRSTSWRRGVKGPLSARFAALRIRIADGPRRRIPDKGQQHSPGEEAWLTGEWRSSGERKYDLSHLPADADLKARAAAIKARWVCEQAHQRMKEELGLDHCEGRSRQGLHRHALMIMIAYAFLRQ